LTEKEERPRLKLKKVGRSVDVRRVAAEIKMLRRFMEACPQEFQALVSLTEGRKEGIGRTTMTILRKCGYVRRDGSPVPYFADLLKAAYRPATPDGPCLVDPLDLRSSQDVALVENAERQTAEDAKRLIDRLRKFRENDAGRE